MMNVPSRMIRVDETMGAIEWSITATSRTAFA